MELALLVLAHRYCARFARACAKVFAPLMIAPHLSSAAHLRCVALAQRRTFGAWP